MNSIPNENIRAEPLAKTIEAKPAKALRLPSLDGWRAISILMVLATHCHFVRGNPPIMDAIFFRFNFGDLGVRFFFVISGFLISWLMITESESGGRVNLGHFYVRRGLRILPVYFAFVGVLWCLSLCTPFKQGRLNWIANLTFMTNFVDGPFTSEHLWSLSVEEQFYLIWPALFVVFKLAKKPQVAGWILFVPIFLAPICRELTYKQFIPMFHRVFTHFSFFNYFDGLALGCLCAFLMRHGRSRLEEILGRWPRAITAGGLGLILIPFSFGPMGLPGGTVVTSVPSLQVTGFGLLMLQSVVHPELTIYRMLNWRLLRHLGVLSYSIYIWQQIFCTSPDVFGLAPPWWMGFPWWIVTSLVVAHISYYLLEQPLFRLRSYFR